MAGTATVTGQIGPGISLSSAVISGVRSFQLISGQQLLELTLEDGQFKWIDITDETTITVTKSGTSYSITVAT